MHRSISAMDCSYKEKELANVPRLTGDQWGVQLPEGEVKEVKCLSSGLIDISLLKVNWGHRDSPTSYSSSRVLSVDMRYRYTNSSGRVGQKVLLLATATDHSKEAKILCEDKIMPTVQAQQHQQMPHGGYGRCWNWQMHSWGKNSFNRLHVLAIFCAPTKSLQSTSSTFLVQARVFLNCTQNTRISSPFRSDAER